MLQFLNSACVFQKIRNKHHSMLRKRIYVKTSDKGNIQNEVLLWDYTTCLNKSMRKDEYGFWHSQTNEIVLKSQIKNSIFYEKVWVDSPKEKTHNLPLSEIIRERVNSEGLEVIVASPDSNQLLPAVVICLGGPFVPIPSIDEKDSIYQYLMEHGYVLIIPLRRGVSGVTQEWEAALGGHYGDYDVFDTISATKYVKVHFSKKIDKNRIFLYGGSYGGYVAELIAGKANDGKMYKAIISHCGVYDLSTYPWHNQGIPAETMLTYGGTNDQERYTEIIAKISPKTYVNNWDVPILLIHHLYDTSSWFGQSVMAYNDALKRGKQVKLLIVPGPHSYDIEYRDILFFEIVSFFDNYR